MLYGVFLCFGHDLGTIFRPRKHGLPGLSTIFGLKGGVEKMLSKNEAAKALGVPELAVECEDAEDLEFYVTFKKLMLDPEKRDVLKKFLENE